MDKSIEAAVDAAFEYTRARGFGATTQGMVRAAIAAYRDAEIERLGAEITETASHYENVLEEHEKTIADLRAKLEASNKELREIAESINDPRVNLTMTAAEWCIEAQSKLEAAERDAERYRWLRENRLWLKANLPMLAAQEFDAGIDSAMRDYYAARGGERG